jgi:plastocyanin
MRKLLLAVAVALAALSVTGAASAANTATVWAGPTGFVKNAGVPKYVDMAQFFPSRIVVNAGDAVTFQTKEGHTVTFPGATTPNRSKLVVPAAGGAVYKNVADPAGTPFWFNGKTEWEQDATSMLAAAGGLTISDATAYHSQVILGPDPTNPPNIKPSVTFTFTKPGVYHYLCLFHMPGMKGTVVVRAAGAPADGTADVQVRAIQQLAAARATTKALIAAPVPPGTIQAGASKDGIDLFVFKPVRFTVKAGTPVKLVSGSAVETHSLFFPGSDKKWVKSYFKVWNQFPSGPVSGEIIYASDPAGTAYDGTNHGSGFFATKAVDLDRSITATPASTTITFTKPGVYKYYGEIHFPDMTGTIVVTS